MAEVGQPNVSLSPSLSSRVPSPPYARADSSTSAHPNVPFFKKSSKSRSANARKRAREDEKGEQSNAQDDVAASEVVIERKKSTGGMIVGRSEGAGASKKARTGETKDADADDDAEDSMTKDPLAEFNRASTSRFPPAPASTMSTSSLNLKSALLPSNDTPARRDGREEEDDGEDDGLYHGAAQYKSQLPGVGAKLKGTKFGPTKAGPDNVRTITLVDYQSDTCKDYRETGYCGFGDSCKFAHIRDDYKRGWEMDGQPGGPKMIWSRSEHGELNIPGDDDKSAADKKDPDEEDDDLPFACLICRQVFTDPIITLCGHSFCQKCSVDRYRKTTKCAAYGSKTGGMFNKAVKLEKRLEKRRQREEEREEEEAAEREAEREELEGVEGLE